jgi:uncharacterized protein
MSFLFEIPAVIRVLFVFTIILVAIHKKMSLGHAFIAGSVIMGLFFGLNPLAIGITMVQSIIYPKTLSLAIIVSLILILSNSLENAGQMQRLLDSFKGLVKNPKINLVVFPALIGLLPMPGGAIFSAPMVKDLGSGLNLSRSKLSYINYWFRHVWEYSWPLYPGILLATILANLNIVYFVLFSFPLTITAFLIGYYPLKGGKNWAEGNSTAGDKVAIGPFFWELTPILIVIFPGLVLGVVITRLFPDVSVAKELGLHISLCLGIFWVWIVNRFDPKRIFKLLSSFQILTMIYLVAAILIFKGVLEQSHAAEEISKELLLLQIPLVLITMFLPFLIGLVSGYTLAFVGVALPILIPLIHTYGESDYMYSYVMLVMACGFAGVLISPLHLCYILSNQYFETTLSAVYKYLWLPTVTIVGLGVAYFFITHQLLF